jgi:hypothetical protein
MQVQPTKAILAVQKITLCQILAHTTIRSLHSKITTSRKFRVSAPLIRSANYTISAAELACSRFKCQSPPDIGDLQEFGGYV